MKLVHALDGCGNCRGSPNPNTTIIDCVRRGRFEDFELAFRPLRSQPMFGRRHAVILDEVQGASKKAIEATLKILETPGVRTLILTTNQPELLPRAVPPSERSRTCELAAHLA